MAGISSQFSPKQPLRFFFFLVVLSLTTLVSYADHQLGDLAPRGVTDGDVNAGDVVIMQQMVLGILSPPPTADELLIGDVAPLPTGDGQINAADLAILIQAALDQITLGTIDIAPPAPTLNPAPVSPTNENPYTITGNSVADANIDIYLNGILNKTITALGDGSFTTTVVLADGVNTIEAAANTGGDSSPLSNPPLVVEFLMAVGGAITDIPAGTTILDQNTIYSVSSNLSVDTGETLIINQGALLEFNGGGITVNAGGELIVNGDAGRPAIFTSSDTVTPLRGDWDGIYVNPGAATVSIDNAEIAYGAIGFWFDNTGTVGSISNTYIHDAFTGVLLTDLASPLISSGNTITLTDRAIYAIGGSGGDPIPLINGNSIHTNNIGNVVTLSYNDNSLVIDATGNWWGDPDPNVIASTIFDFDDDRQLPYESPTVNFGNYLDAENGNPATGVYFAGAITGNFTLTGDTEYTVLGLIRVDSGATLTIDPGATLKFINTSLDVDGTLQIQGDATNKVTLTSFNSVPSKGDWQGININATSSNTVVDNAVIEWASTGITATASINTTVSSTRVNDNQSSGISFLSGADGLITGNVVTGHTGSPNTGIYIQQSQPSITNNEVVGNYYGIWIDAASPNVDNNLFSGNQFGVRISGTNANPVFTANSIVFNDSYGIWIQGTGNDTTSAQPVFTGNDIHSNSQLAANIRDVWITGYSASSAIILDFSQNWWGEAAPNMADRLLGQTTLVDSSLPSVASNAAILVTGITLDNPYISPNADTIKDSATFSATLNESTNWRVEISNNVGVIETFENTSNLVSFNWDGLDAMSTAYPDANYTVSLTSLSAKNIYYLDSGFKKQITIDNTQPTSDIDNTINNTIINSQMDSFSVSGTSSDLNYDSYTLDYGEGVAPVAYTPIASGVTLPVLNNVLGVWNIVQGSNMQLANGQYTLRLTVTDLAGNPATDTVLVTLDNTRIDNVTQSLLTLNPSLGDILDVDFDISGSASGSVSMTIKEAMTGTVVRTVEQPFGGPGAYKLSWDGKDGLGSYVTDNAFVFELSANNGKGSAEYLSLQSTGFLNVNLSFYPFGLQKNILLERDISVTGSGVKVTFCTTEGAQFVPFNCNGAIVPFYKEDMYFAEGDDLLFWDGRNTNGDLVDETQLYAYTSSVVSLPTNYVITKGLNSFVKGEGSPPNIIVKSNPYFVRHSYDEISQIKFQLDQDANVTVKLLPPGISNPNDSSAIVIMPTTLLTAEVSPGVPMLHVAEWVGYDLSLGESEINNSLTEQEGMYTFVVEADGVLTGASTIYRGMLSLYY